MTLQALVPAARGQRRAVTEALARALVAAYVLHLAASELETWWHLRSVEAQRAAMRHRPLPGEEVVLRPLPFPWPTLGMAPLALAAALGPALPLAWLWAALLLACTLWRDAGLAWLMARNVLHGARPTELLMKQLALTGSGTMLLAASIRDAPPRVRAVTAGLLQVDDPRERRRLGLRRSSVLLVARLLVAALCVWAGVQQVRHMCEKSSTSAGPSLPGQQATHHYGRADPHDSVWLVVQAFLAVPLALGLCTNWACGLLSAALLVEAVACWQWWWGAWPSWSYRQHVREHFFANASIAGGLLLLRSCGGLLSVDALLAAKRE